MSILTQEKELHVVNLLSHSCQRAPPAILMLINLPNLVNSIATTLQLS